MAKKNRAKNAHLIHCLGGGQWYYTLSHHAERYADRVSISCSNGVLVYEAEGGYDDLIHSEFELPFGAVLSFDFLRTLWDWGLTDSLSYETLAAANLRGPRYLAWHRISLRRVKSTRVAT